VSKSPKHQIGDFVGPFIRWWSLDNVGVLGTAAFGLIGGVAALAAVNFFYFAPEIPQPTVTHESFIDASKLTTNIDPAVMRAVNAVTTDLTSANLRDPKGTYDAGQALASDCVLYHDYIDQLDPQACEVAGLGIVEYPPYLHDLIVRGAGLLKAQRVGAYTILQAAATQVDAVTVTNKGAVAASEVDMDFPAGLQPVEAGLDRVPFSIPARATRILLFRSAPASAVVGEALPVEGFAITKSTGDTVIDQDFARTTLAVGAILLGALVISDMYRTRGHSGRRSPPDI
jgi:hypothetical protein